MAWIELHQTLPRHPKLARLANRLRITRAQAAGHLTFLWLWALDYAPHGDVSALEPAEISAAADFGGDAELFCRALRESGWIDGDGRIHDWLEYAGRIITGREQSKKRMKAWRDRKNNEQAKGAVVTRNEPVTNSERAELPYHTIPYHTLDASKHLSARGREQSSFPMLSEVETEADMRGIPKDVADAFWHHFEAMGWIDKNANPIQQWRPKLQTWWIGEKEKRAKSKLAAKPAGGERREIQENIALKIV